MTKKIEKTHTEKHLGTNLVFVLHEGCRMGDWQRVQFALDQGVGIDTPNNILYNGWTALHYAAHWGRENIVYRLLALGANPEVVNERNLTPYDVCHPDRVEIKRSLASALEQKVLARELNNVQQGRVFRL